MDIPNLLTALTDAGDRLADAADTAGWGAAVPSCPEWNVRELVFHLGAVHRWAARFVRDGRSEPITHQLGGDPLRDAADRPDDAELLGWFREGHRALVKVIDAAPDDLECWSFLPASSPRTFWARRQAHETTIHRVDAELAAGVVTPIDPAVATDGIDELLTGFVPRRKSKLRSETPRRFAVHATDTDTHWLLRISGEPVVTERVDEPADATVRGPAADVYLALWNRLSLGAVDAFGDAELLATWHELVRVRWS